MAFYWWLNLAVWGACMLYSAPAAATAAFVPSKTRRGDPMLLATFLVSALFFGHNARWLFAPHSDDAWKALYFVGAMTGVYVLRLMVAYGRGERV